MLAYYIMNIDIRLNLFNTKIGSIFMNLVNTMLMSYFLKWNVYYTVCNAPN
jgi:hypothetical protein